MLVTLVVMAGMVMARVVVARVVVARVVVVQVMDFDVVVFQRACGRARGEVVVLKIKGTACGCICCGGQMSAFRRFWRVSDRKSA